ncbi:MAG: guanylate kinase [Flavobacteriales bacterium]|nr:guanylate kinase [Flavobacteriales bacterium]MDG1780127.1 guanylate kinase [Flavobacteriales bacterium]MDG2246832.1 guanylate kinase [Flavobacteriales bacterium]
MSFNQQEGKCVIFSAPSGAGKTTIVHHILQQNLPLAFSISATSRAPRPVERDGKDYHYMSVTEFKQQIDADAFVEWEEVYENQFYGTLKSEIERIWSEGKHVIFDVDVVGGVNLKTAFGDKAISVFVKAPSVQALEDRLRTRATETDESIARRIAKANMEMDFATEFDYVLINDDLETAKAEAFDLITTFLKS